MTIQFAKYQGTGNDFIMIDNRDLHFPKEDVALIEKLCTRRFGIGADGLILLENDVDFDFRMVYFNADGRESTMCGNGGRCIVAFAKDLGVIQGNCKFIAIDGPHEASIDTDNLVSLGMKMVEEIEQINATDYFLDTGSPHYVRVVDKMPLNFVEQAKVIRHSERFDKDGVNVNFIVLNEGDIEIRTFERGVEDETFSCGTGAVAAGIIANEYNKNTIIPLKTKGGRLLVDLTYKNLLIGMASKVYKGYVNTK